jgi:hypothetical protein
MDNGDNGERTTNYKLPKKTAKNCILGLAYTYKVQEGYYYDSNGIGIGR